MGYKYKVKDWLTNINDVTTPDPDKLFNFRIGYNTGANPLFNGNISGTQWRTANVDSSLKTYDYTYDPLNRITGAADNTVDQRYGLSGVAYDKNGNVLELARKGHLGIGGGHLRGYGRADLCL